MLTLTFVAILFVALLAHVSGGRATHGGEGIARALDSRAILACVFLTTFGVLWYSWAAWNPIPVVHDEMAYVFQAQVFARGIWALPAPPFPAFWEQPHFLIEPTVTIKYFPGHPLVLAVGALVGWMALMPLVLQSSIAVLLYVLARRVSSGAVALLAWVIWLFTPMVLYFGASYFSEATPAIFGQRVLYLFISTWGVTSGLLGVFAVLGLLTVGAEVAFAVGSGLLLIVAYLAYATPARWTLYYYETVPAFTYLSAAGLAWAASMIGRPRGTPQSLSFNWRSPRWTRALVAGALVIGLPGIVALRIIRGQHVSDRKVLARFDKLLKSIPDPKAIVFVRYAATHNPHVTFVRNVANPETQRIWVIYDRGEAGNARLLASVPERTAYLFDESRGRTYVYDPGALP